MQKQIYKQLGYSIRKCNEDEIEIRLSRFDGYIRGFFRAVVVGILCVGMYFDTSSGIQPFSNEIRSIREDFIWAFNPDEILKKEYIEIKEMAQDPDFMMRFPDNKLEPYNEFKERYVNYHFINIIRAYFHFIWIPFTIFLIFLPRMNGVRINRKKRLIYWRSIVRTFEIAYVPEQGNPLGGIIYNKFGIYAFGGMTRCSLLLHIVTQSTKETASQYVGVYPSVGKEQNDQLLLAIQAYLTEENPEFLNHIGTRFKVCSDLFIAFCNFAALPCYFSRKKANIALDEALKHWAKKTENQKQGWFNEVRSYQKIVDQQLAEQDLDNRIRTEV